MYITILLCSHKNVNYNIGKNNKVMGGKVTLFVDSAYA